MLKKHKLKQTASEEDIAVPEIEWDEKWEIEWEINALNTAKLPRKCWKTTLPSVCTFRIHWARTRSNLTCIAGSSHPLPIWHALQIIQQSHVYSWKRNTNHILNLGEMLQTSEIITPNHQKIECMVIYGSAGGKSVVEEQCEDTYSSKRWHLFLLAARFSFLQSTQ